jgi:hypothetical protein
VAVPETIVLSPAPQRPEYDDDSIADGVRCRYPDWAAAAMMLS